MITPERLVKMLNDVLGVAAELPPELLKQFPKFDKDGTLACEAAPDGMVCDACALNAARVIFQIGLRMGQKEGASGTALEDARQQRDELGRAMTRAQTAMQEAKKEILQLRYELEHAKNEAAIAKDDLEKAREKLGFGPDGEYDPWLDDRLQFARLICTQLYTEQMRRDLRIDMGLEEESDLLDLLQRAESIWGRYANPGVSK